jgi:hypothetical protein
MMSNSLGNHSEIQSHTAIAAPFTASIAPVTMLRNVSLFFHAITNAAVRAAMAITTRPIGLADMAALSSHWAAACAFAAAAAAKLAMRAPMVAVVLVAVAAVSAPVAVILAQVWVMTFPNPAHSCSAAPARSAKPIAICCTLPVRKPSITSAVPPIVSARPMNFPSALPAPSPSESKLSPRSRLTLPPASCALLPTSAMPCLKSSTSPRTTALMVWVRLAIRSPWPCASAWAARRNRRARERCSGQTTRSPAGQGRCGRR